MTLFMKKLMMILCVLGFTITPSQSFSNQNEGVRTVSYEDDPDHSDPDEEYDDDEDEDDD